MQTLAILAQAGGSFRLTLDLSAWAAVGVSLAPAVIRLQARAEGASAISLEFATGGANPVTFDPMTGLAVFAAAAPAVAALTGRYPFATRAEFAGSTLALFGGELHFLSGIDAPSGGNLAVGDTAWVAGQTFGPAPVPAPLATAVASAQAAARDAFIRSLIYGG